MIQLPDDSRCKAFWSWFVNNASRFRIYQENQEQEQIFDEINQQLSTVHPDLTFEIGPIGPEEPEENDKLDFIVSADGIREAFPAVERLCKLAPELHGWRVVCFRPRGNIDLPIQMGDAILKPDDVWFKEDFQNDCVDLTLYIKGLSSYEQSVLVQLSYLLLDNALGEYDVETKIGAIERLPLPKNPESEGLKPFRELPAVVDRHQHG